MMDDSLFFKVLSEKHKDLLEISAKKKYIFMVPYAKYITPNMLNRVFYDNHTFYTCDYDDKMHINLNGKVLEFKNNQFQTFLGFKKQMIFNFQEKCNREVNNIYVDVIYIDNVIDETHFNQNVVTKEFTKKEMLKRYNNKDDYVKYYNNLLRTSDELKEIDPALADLIDKLQNNYILIKNHVHTYSKYFQELGSEFRSYLGNKLGKYKVDDSFNLIIYELCESLIFNKIYQFLYLNIKQFTADEEADLKAKMNVFKTEFSFSIYKLDTLYNECKFKSAISEIKKIVNYSTPFEKMGILNQVNTQILKEAKECVEKYSNKKKFSPSANELIPFWIFVIINAEIPCLLAECTILQDFKIQDYSLISETGYNLAHLINAVEMFNKDDLPGQSHRYSQITPSIITTKSSVPDATFDINSSRSQSMSSFPAAKRESNTSKDSISILSGALSLVGFKK